MIIPEPLLAKIPSVPDDPGCYLWKDAEGRVIYVGKAKHLRRRVASYVQRLDEHQPRTRRMLADAVDLEWLVAGSEIEALLTESMLIKELQPRYNVLLKDGKDYPLLAITREEFPRVFLTRDRNLAGADLLGPFPSAGDLQRATHFLQRAFRFRTCDLDLREDDPARRSFAPCLNWHIKRCSAPCTTRIGAAEYGEDIRALRAFVSGRGRGDLLDGLRARMRAAAGDLRFEDAARVRDQIQAIERLSERGRLADWANHDKCAAGTGLFLQAMAKLMQMPLEEFSRLSLEAKGRADISGTCAVFSESEVISHVHRVPPTPKPDIAAGIYFATVSRLMALCKRIGIEKDVAVVGGVALNIGLVRILEGELGFKVIVPDNPQTVAALGAAIIAKESLEAGKK